MDQGSPEQHPPLRPMRASFATQRAIVALILREMSTTYGRSPGGYIWAIVEPVAGIAVLTAIFSAGFRSPPLGNSFSIFYASGILIFLMYGDLSAKLTQTIPFSRALLEYPRVTLMDALLARFILNTLTQIMVHFIVAGALYVFLRPDLTVDMIPILQAYAIILILSFGIGTINSFLVLTYPVWQTVWAILNRPLFLISCLFFVFESVPQPWSDILWYNPLVHPVGLMREGIYPFYQPNYISIAYPMALGAILTITGLLLLGRYYRDMLLK